MKQEFLEELRKLCLKHDVSIVPDERWLSLTDYDETWMQLLMKAPYEPLEVPIKAQKIRIR